MAPWPRPPRYARVPSRWLDRARLGTTDRLRAAHAHHPARRYRGRMPACSGALGARCGAGPRLKCSDAFSAVHLWAEGYRRNLIKTRPPTEAASIVLGVVGTTHQARRLGVFCTICPRPTRACARGSAILRYSTWIVVHARTRQATAEGRWVILN